MSAAMAGVLILAAAAWLWREVQGHSDKLIPISNYTVTLAPATGEARAGQTVSLRGESAVAGEIGPEIGSALVVSSESTSNGGDRLVIAPPTFVDNHSISDLKSVAPAPGSGATIRGTTTGPAQVKRLFEALYLQAGVVGLLMVLGTAITYYLVGIRHGSVEFLIATDGEMKKVNWSTKKNIRDSTTVVILWSLVLAFGLFAIDLFFAQFFKIIGVLQH
jgi:preprotein translocase SecE subunit